MSLEESVSLLLGIPEPAARFLIGLFLACVLSFIYRALISVQSVRIQSIFSSISGIGLMYYVFGITIWHSALDIVTVYSLLSLFGGTKLSLLLTWTVTMSHMVIGYTHIALSDQVHPIAWTIPHCVLVLKLIGLVYSLYDGNKTESVLSKEERDTCISTLPPFIEVLGYCYFFGSVLAGPQISFKRYHQFVSKSLYDENRAGSSIIPGLSRLSLALVLTVVYALLNQYYPLKYILSEDYAESSFVTKLVVMIIIGKLAMWRYMTVWLIAEGACVISGISYKNTRLDGSTDWTAVHNVHFTLCEQSITLQGTIDSFNVQTNKWVAMYVYKRLKWLGSKELSHILSMMFLILWHGIWPGYFICFSFEFFVSIAERQFIAIGKQWINMKELSWFLFIPVWTSMYLLKNIMLMYPLMSFMLLSWEDCRKFMSSLHWIGHVVVILWYSLYWLTIRNNKNNS